MASHPKASSRVDDELFRVIASGANVPSKPYPAARLERTNRHFPALGIDVPDDYAWLEDPARQDVAAWRDAEAAYTASLLSKMPIRSRLRMRVASLLEDRGGAYECLVRGGDRVFALRSPGKHRPARVVSLPLALDPAGENVLLDPALLDPTGASRVAWIAPSHSGAVMAYALRDELGATRISVIDVASKKERRADAVEGASATANTLAWLADDSGFYFVRDAESGASAQSVWLHTLARDGRPDTPIGPNLANGTLVELETAPGGDGVLVRVRAADEEVLTVLLFGLRHGVKNVASGTDRVRLAKFGPAGDIYLVSEEAKITKLTGKALARPLAKAEASLFGRAVEVSVHELDRTAQRVSDILPAEGGLLVVAKHAAGETLLTEEGAVPTAVGGPLGLISLGAAGALVRAESLLVPPSYYRLDTKRAKLEKTPLESPGNAKFDDAEVVQLPCRATDGRAVTMTVVQKRGLVADGSNPTWLSVRRSTAAYDPVGRILLDAGFVLAFANVAGPGQRPARETRRVFDDFAACADGLVVAKYTKPAALVMDVGGEEGFLAGGMLTEHPELFGAVVARDALYDPLRGRGAERESASGEAGDVAALYSVSPYHHAREHVFYPPALLSTLEGRGRHEPWQSWKMVARLQSATDGAPPIALREGGAPYEEARIDEQTDVLLFVFKVLGVPYTP